MSSISGARNEKVNIDKSTLDKSVGTKRRCSGLTLSLENWTSEESREKKREKGRNGTKLARTGTNFFTRFYPLPWKRNRIIRRTFRSPFFFLFFLSLSPSLSPFLSFFLPVFFCLSPALSPVRLSISLSWHGARNSRGCEPSFQSIQIGSGIG